ncbi:MAG: leucine-rich repeat domain-containing protein, partial [Bryobacteraceae bacterium]
MERLIALCLLTALGALAGERDIAEWVIRWDGRLFVEGKGQPIHNISDIPTGRFEITAIDLTGGVMAPSELEKLSGLTTLRELYLPGPIWNPGGGGGDANPALKFLSTLKSLERLSVGTHYSSNIGIQDRGLNFLSGLAELKELRCSQCRVASFNLGQFPKLHTLDVSYSSFNDTGMKGLAGLKNLRRLNVRQTLVTDEGLKHLAGLVQLEDLDISGPRITDEGIVALRGLTAMRKLNLQGAAVSDASIDVFAGMKQLKFLNLYRSRITNAGLARLNALKELANVDLRYSRVTSNGVESLRAALPNCKVQFVASSVARPKAAGAARPASASESAVADWVKAMGGAAEFSGGRLKSVNLSSTSVSDAQLEHVAKLTGLEKLELEATQIGDLGLAALQSLATLKELNLA